MSKTFISSDWHLFKMPGGRRPSIDYKAADIIIPELEKLTKNDTFIYLGDLMDDGIRLPLHGDFASILEKISERIMVAKSSIFIRGNNDDQSDDFYKSIGFTSVVYAKHVEVLSRNVILSHTSIDISDDTDGWINVHGHIHRPSTDPDEITYYHNPVNCINICTVNKRELRLTALEEMDLNKELIRNNTWSPGYEHSGMSTLCQNQAYRIYINSK